ncbi:MAG: hypothetical protein NTW86_02545 [Candidatus Sumerlaeota bacterium]|nr:hypothetical protein [Candidatus Sumerlaeota bacterium]
MKEEQAIFKVQARSEEMVELIRHAAEVDRAIGAAAEDLWRQMLEVNRLLLQSFVDAQGSGDVGPTLEQDGRTWRRVGGGASAALRVGLRRPCDSPDGVWDARVAEA